MGTQSYCRQRVLLLRKGSSEYQVDMNPMNQRLSEDGNSTGISVRIFIHQALHDQAPSYLILKAHF